MVEKGPGGWRASLSTYVVPCSPTLQTEGRKKLLTTLIDHFTTSITELIGIERPSPLTDLRKGDRQSRHAVVYCPERP